jgi:hypothetical protein
MKIRDIKNKELRELAESRIDKEYYYYEKFLISNELNYAFKWYDTKEGFDFWGDVDEGKITELPEELQPIKSIAEEAFSNIPIESELRVANNIINVLQAEINELRDLLKNTKN